MTSCMKSVVLLASCGSLVGCGSGTREEPVNTDYSALRLAPSHEGALSYATSDEQLLRAVRNGLRMSLVGAPQIAAVVGISAPRADSAQGTFLSTGQVDGVDEADLLEEADKIVREAGDRQAVQQRARRVGEEELAEEVRREDADDPRSDRDRE